MGYCGAIFQIDIDNKIYNTYDDLMKLFISPDNVYPEYISPDDVIFYLKSIGKNPIMSKARWQIQLTQTLFEFFHI